MDEEKWATRDGRELLLDEMAPQHIGNARKKLSNWIKGEPDPEKRRELRGWTKRFSVELKARHKAWKERHAR